MLPSNITYTAKEGAINLNKNNNNNKLKISRTEKEKEINHFIGQKNAILIFMRFFKANQKETEIV